MASNIDPTKPTSGLAYTADVRANFTASKTEIEALQSGKQDLDATLTALAALATAANKMLYFTGVDAPALIDSTAAGRKLLGTASNAIRIPHTWTISGDVKIASGETDFIIPMFVPVPAGRYANIVAARAKLNAGTSATVKIQTNGTDRWTGLSVTTTAANYSSTVALADGDRINLVVTAVSGAPKNMAFSLYIDYGVA